MTIHRDPDFHAIHDVADLERDGFASSTSPGRGPWEEPPDSETGAVAVDYCGAIDEFVLTVADAPDIECFEPLDDLEIIFDATRPGRLLGLSVRGARLNRPRPWLRAVRTVLGPTLWETYRGLAGAATQELLSGDGDEVSVELEVPDGEWSRLRHRTWLALHQSLHQGEWWDAEPELADPIEFPEETAEEPWVLAAPRPTTHGATNLQLPTPLAEACGLKPIGYARHVEGRLAISFDIETEKREPRCVKLELAGPCAAAASGARHDEEYVVTFDTDGPLSGIGLLVLVVEAGPRTPEMAGAAIGAEQCEQG